MKESEVYLFTGPELGDKSDAITTILNNARKRDSALDEYSYYVSDKSVAEVVALLQNVGLFSSSLFVIYKNCEQIKLKSDVDLLVSYIKESADNPNTLILLSDENNIDKRIESAVPSSHKKIFWEMFENQKPQWVRNFFRKNGFSITDDAIESILNMVENNTQSLKIEGSKFFYCYPKGYEITCADVDKILTHNREENAFTLFEAMSDSSLTKTKRLEESLDILQKIRLSRESNGVSLIAGLTYCFRQLLVWQKLNSGSVAVSETTLKANGFTSKKNREKYIKASKIWTTGETFSIISLLADTDISIREEGTSLENIRLTALIYSIVIGNGIYMAEYE